MVVNGASARGLDHEEMTRLMTRFQDHFATWRRIRQRWSPGKIITISRQPGGNSGLDGRTQESDQLRDDHFRRWAVVLTCKHAALCLWQSSRNGIRSLR
jgi:hypothetical protein